MTNEQKLKISNWLLSPDKPSDLLLTEAEKKIKELGLEKVYKEIELPLVEVLDKMHKTGIAVDRKKIEKLLAEYSKKIKSLEKKIYKEAEEKFNINSPQQLRKILNNKFRLNLRSTNIGSIIDLRSQYLIIDLILQYREAFKVKSTYLERFFTDVQNDETRRGRIYTTFLQTGTATGRLSSQNPNLQNVPLVVKEVFVADRGWQLVSFDYSQVELRILAALSRDPKMIKTFTDNGDIHKMTASHVFNTELSKVTAEMRRLAKTLNFGVVYGMGAVAFARTSGLSIKEARSFIEEYFSDFEQIKKWQEEIKRRARENGYVENLNGRKRWLPAINSTSQFLAAEAERAAINMPVQGLAADIIKLAMVEIYRQLKKSKDTRLLLTIHDELLFEIKSDKVKKRVEEIKNIMEGVYKLPDVELEVDVKVGKNWKDLHVF
ncbi:MAG: DNA polymerase [Patescibacteria group bacterium]